MKKCLIVLLITASAMFARADQKIMEAQRSLKDQGFYYGDVSGEKNTETADAVRRYQIRNGLTVNGELDEPTLQSIRKTASTAQATPAQQPAHVPATGAPEPARDSAQPPPAVAQEPAQPFDAGAPPPPISQRVPDALSDGRTVPEPSGLFVRTPYEAAPPEIQRRVVMDAQRRLSEHGLYKFQADGVFSPNMEFSLRAYQSRVGLRPSGRLDLETLAALELLPGSRRHAVLPRRFLPAPEPPVRGEWIRP